MESLLFKTFFRVLFLSVALVIGLAPAITLGCTCPSEYTSAGSGTEINDSAIWPSFPGSYYGHTYCNFGDNYTGCIPADPLLGTSATTSGGTSTAPSTVVSTFQSEIKTSISTAAIDNIAANENGHQTSSLLSAQEIAALGAGQAATIGAVNCAQGANANLTSPSDAAAFYAICQQNFEAAKGMNGKLGGFNPNQSILDNAAAQQSLQDFEKNFGVAPPDYLKRMLGDGGGLNAVSELVNGKIPDAKLAEAMDAASKLGASDLTQDPDKFAVDLGRGAKKSVASLRDALKKKLADKSEDRKTASVNEENQGEKIQEIGDKEHLEPLGIETAFGSKEENRELTIFDVVHMRYSKLAARMHR